MITHKTVDGEVVYNDGSFAEVETSGVEGGEACFFLGTVQLHVEDTEDTPQEFQRRFPVGTRCILAQRPKLRWPKERLNRRVGLKQCTRTATGATSTSFLATTIWVRI